MIKTENMNPPLISVCVPAYNHEQYIVQALDSVLEQDWPNTELVIINDGSRDSTEALIETWIGDHEKSIPVTFCTRPNNKAIE